MDWTEIENGGLAMLGCGHMGGALLDGWLERGLDPEAVWIADPEPSGALSSRQGVHLNEAWPARPAVLILAVKPQIMDDALASLGDLSELGAGETLIVSIAAGLPIARFAAAFGDAAPIVRVMPNTPAAIGHGASALVGNDRVGAAQMDAAEALMAAVGATERLTSEAQMDAVTALSGSGPAYLFHLIEALAAAGEAEGLERQAAARLAIATMAGAAHLAAGSDQSPAELRRGVTSPGGTTEAGLDVLMDERHGLAPLMRRTLAAAAARSRELGG